MQLQEAIARQLALTSGSTYAALNAIVSGAGTRVYWAIAAKNQTPPFVWLRKAARRPLTKNMDQAYREPAETTIEVFCVAKTQASAATVADAVSTDMLAIAGLIPAESPTPAGQVYAQKVYPLSEEDVVSEDALDLGLFGEMRSFVVYTRTA